MKSDRFSPAAALFNVRIAFARQTVTDDGVQTILGPPAILGHVWAMRRDISDGERYKAGELAADLTARFVVRINALTSQITPKDIIVHKGDLAIVGIKTISEGTLLEFTTADRSDK